MEQFFDWRKYAHHLFSTLVNFVRFTAPRNKRADGDILFQKQSSYLYHIFKTQDGSGIYMVTGFPFL